MQLVGIIHKCNGTYGISFPDLPGCVSAGDSEAEVVANAIEAVDFHLEGVIEDGGPIPMPRGLDVLLADPEYSEDFEDNWKVVHLPFPPKGLATAGSRRPHAAE
jgi:predicted RNase H-like HicB family nuclease